MWQKEIDISLKGCMLIIYELSKILKKSKNSTIINFSSDLELYHLTKIFILKILLNH